MLLVHSLRFPARLHVVRINAATQKTVSLSSYNCPKKAGAAAKKTEDKIQISMLPNP
jgi:hypothetical protein